MAIETNTRWLRSAVREARRRANRLLIDQTASDKLLAEATRVLRALDGIENHAE